MKRTVLLCGLCVFLMLGCFARGGLAGAVTVNLDYSLHQVYDATRYVIRAQGMPIESESKKDGETVITSRAAEKDMVTFHGERFTDKASSLTIQIGAFGDEAASQALLDAIAARLQAAETDRK